MKKNFITDFADWYILNKESNGSNYYSNFFKEDRDIFIKNLSEYAVEFAISFGYNPFVVDTDNVSAFISTAKRDLEARNTSFASYSSSKSNHMPRAILGGKNYLDFLEKRYVSDTLLSEIKLPVESVVRSTIISSFNKTELRGNFYFRLISQDRFYDFLYFPISVLKKVFYANNEREFFDNWINTQIDNILIHTDETTPIPFVDIETLEIMTNGSVLLNSKLALHTGIAGSNDKKQINAIELKNIVIDHIEPLEKVLKSKKEELPALMKVHNLLMQINGGRKITNRGDLALSGNLLNNMDFISKEDIVDLKVDLNLIAKDIQLQLMDRYENLYKKKYS